MDRKTVTSGTAAEPWSLLHWSAGLGIITCAALAGEFLGPALAHARTRFDAPALVLTLALRETLALAAVWYVATTLRITANALGVRRPRLGAVALGVVLGVVYLVVTAVAFTWLFPHEPPSPFFVAIRTATPPLRIALVLLVGVYSPLVQEVVFRGVLLNGLARWAGALPALAVSAVIFAAVHASTGAASVLQTFAFGLVTGALFLRTRSLTVPIAMHVATNTTASLWVLAR
jgi:membrane protease YdiL (CAAX protease family)